MLTIKIILFSSYCRVCRSIDMYDDMDMLDTVFKIEFIVHFLIFTARK